MGVMEDLRKGLRSPFLDCGKPQDFLNTGQGRFPVESREVNLIIP